MMGTGLGRMLSMVGAFLALIGATLPWTSESYGVIATGLDGLFVYVFGLFWFVSFPVPRKIHAILGAGWGVSALMLGLLAIAFFVGLGVTLEYGVYVSILGSIFLILGSALSYVKAVRPLPLESVPPGRPERERDKEGFGNMETSEDRGYGSRGASPLGPIPDWLTRRP
jgi:uncharacterized YccA/Bax inhibitor family protein